jgi:hypothetical protein
LPHHDITPLPNGNVLLVAWDSKTAEEALAAGRREDLVGGRHLLSECILEVKPTGKTTGEIVWRWNVWDHLIQDHDPTKPSYGKTSTHPELIDINLSERLLGSRTPGSGVFAEERRSLGFWAGPIRGLHETLGSADLTTDWIHINSVAYNAELDQIILSVRAFSEIWIIDHGTTSAEAAAHTGGRYGRGGDLLYRWGNPVAHRSGTAADQRLFKQHHAHWIANGLPGAGHILLFNNGNNRPGGPYSSADEIAMPMTADGQYDFGRSPDQPEWSYAAPNKKDLYSMVVGGAQRLPNGNTLISAGANGTLLEVTAEKEVVWKFVNPVKGSFLGFHLPSAGAPRKGRGGLPAINNALFRAPRYAPDFPGFRGKSLKPGQLLAELAATKGAKTD